MELPQKLLNQYPSVRTLVQKPVQMKPDKPMFRQYPAMFTFDDGGSMMVNVTARNKPYWGGQLENEIKREWNKNPSHIHKIVRVKIFRNSKEGGFLIKNNKVIKV